MSVLEILTQQLREAADEDDRLGRGEFRLLDVADGSGSDEFRINVRTDDGPRSFLVKVSAME